MLYNHHKDEVVTTARLRWREKCDDLQKEELGKLKSQGTHPKKRKYHLTATLNLLTALKKCHIS